MPIEAVIFDLDGVIVSTDACHYRAWKRVADEEGLPFDRALNERLRGVSRPECLRIILDHAGRRLTAEHEAALAERKNAYYRGYIGTLTTHDLLPGVLPLLDALRARGVKLAIGSSSRNCGLVLDRLGLRRSFDATADGNDIARSKPDPEVFLLAAQRLGVPTARCLVIEDADAGVEAGVAAGMTVLAVGAAAGHARAHRSVAGLDAIGVDALLAIGGQ